MKIKFTGIQVLINGKKYIIPKKKLRFLINAYDCKICDDTHSVVKASFFFRGEFRAVKFHQDSLYNL